MKKILNIIVLVALLFLFQGNMIGQKSFTSAGGNCYTGDGSVSYSVGQVFYTYSVGDDGNTVSKGVQQSYDTEALPIELMDFQASPTEEYTVKLTWQTSLEINNHYFTVERSKDVEDWQFVMFVQGAGNSNVELNYLEYDLTPFGGTSYYRLKQTDFDGTFTFSEIRTVNLGRYHINCYPSPTYDNVTLSIEGYLLDDMSYTLYDILGRQIENKSIEEPEQVINMKALAPATYFLKVMEKGELIQTIKVVKLIDD